MQDIYRLTNKILKKIRKQNKKRVKIKKIKNNKKISGGKLNPFRGKNWMYNYYQYKKENAQARNIPFNLTFEEFTGFWLNEKIKCYYCHINSWQYQRIRKFILNELHKINTYSLKIDLLWIKDNIFQHKWCKKHNRLTVDRYNNNIGYEKNNLVISCWVCNSLKFTSKMTPELQTKLYDFTHSLLNIAYNYWKKDYNSHKYLQIISNFINSLRDASKKTSSDAYLAQREGHSIAVSIH